MDLRFPFGLNAFWMTIQESWKGFVVYMLIMLVMFARIIQVCPSFAEAFLADVAEAQRILLEWEDENVSLANLSWTPVEGATNYTVLQDNQSFALGSFIGLITGEGVDNLTLSMAYIGTNTSLMVTLPENETMYYIVLIELADGNMTSTGVVSSEALITANPFDEFLNNSAYQGFTGGRDLDMLDIRGFMSIYVGSYLSIMIGFYAAYLGVTVVSRDVERKSMDIILSTPISRRRLLLERTAAVSAMILLLLILLLGAVFGSLSTLNVNVDSGDVTATFLLSFPLMLVIIAWSAILSVVLNDMKTAMGASFGLVFVLYIMSFASSITESLNYLADISPFGYYRFSDLLYGDWDSWGDIMVLVVLSAVLMFIGLELFKRKELPT